MSYIGSYLGGKLMANEVDSPWDDYINSEIKKLYKHVKLQRVIISGLENKMKILEEKIEKLIKQ